VAGVVAAAALLAAACSPARSHPPTTSALVGAPTPPPASAAPATLTVGLFGTFGYKESGLYDAYHQLCPNVTIKEDNVEQSADYWTRLKTRLASGSGLTSRGSRSASWPT
jgi:cellobiose transport system substrate-binding protein